MLVLFGVLIGIAPFAVVIGLLAWTAWRERRRREVEDRQIAVTDGIHERLGAAAAPIVCRRRRGWQVRMAGAVPASSRDRGAPGDRATGLLSGRTRSRFIRNRLDPSAPNAGYKADSCGRSGVAVMDMSDCATGILARDGIGSTAEAPRTSTPEALHG
jgi:hypothetical protein